VVGHQARFEKPHFPKLATAGWFNALELVVVARGIEQPTAADEEAEVILLEPGIEYR
jgi:hypothetical protein